MSGNPQIFPPSALKSTLAELTSAELEVLAAISLGSVSSDQERLSAFLNRVFSRAPTDVIRRKRAPELLCVTRGCLEVLAKHRTEPKQLAISYQRAENWGGLFIALTDRPFIISSIAERLYEAEISLECYQHPILTIDGASVALSYIEVAPRSHDLVEPIIPQIKDTLEALATVVSDHQEMLKATKSIAIQSSAALASEWGALSGDEVKLFLEWLTTGTFFFVGVSTWRDQQTSSDGHGIWRCEGSYSATLRNELTKDLNSAESAGLTFSLHKLRIASCVHRRAPLINILIKPSRGEQSWVSIVGYLTSKAWAHEAQDIPVLRAKLGQILASEETPIDSHDYKYVIEVIDNMPTDEALRMPVRDLRVIAQLALGVFSRDDSRSVTCLDAQRRWALTTIVMPPSRFSADVRQEIQGLVERFLGARDRSSETHLDSSKKRQLRLYISTPISNERLNEPNLDELGRLIQRATLSWSELLEEQLRATSLEQPNQDAQLDFPESYQASTPIAEAIHDLELAKRCQTATPLAVSLCAPRDAQRAPNLSFISHQRSTSLSSAVPVLENVGLEVLDANSYSLSVMTKRSTS
jgi:glutamate dehydrogenase